MVLFEPALALLFCLSRQFLLVGFLVVGLFLWAEHVGDELVAGFFRVDFSLNGAPLGLLPHLLREHLLNFLLLK